MNKNIKAWKVVAKENGKYFSVIATSEILYTEYKFNKKVKAPHKKAPLFAFKTRRAARYWARFVNKECSHKIQCCIFKCEGEKSSYEPVSILNANIVKTISSFEDYFSVFSIGYSLPDSTIFLKNVKLIKNC